MTLLNIFNDKFMEETVRSHPARGPDRAWPLGQRLLVRRLVWGWKATKYGQVTMPDQGSTGCCYYRQKLPTKLVMTIGVPLLLLDLVSIVNWAWLFTNYLQMIVIKCFGSIEKLWCDSCADVEGGTHGPKGKYLGRKVLSVPAFSLLSISGAY